MVARNELSRYVHRHASKVLTLLARNATQAFEIQDGRTFTFCIQAAGPPIVNIRFFEMIIAVQTQVSGCTRVVGFTVPIENTFSAFASEDAATFGGTQSSVMLNTRRFAVPNAG